MPASGKATTLGRTHPPHPSGEPPSTASSALAAVPASAAQTLIGLQALVGSESRIPLDPEWIAKQLFPGLPLHLSTDRVIRDVLVLEDAGHARTWAQNDREWLALPHRSGHAHEPAQASTASSPASPSTGPFSLAWEREGEREGTRVRAGASEGARARARELMDSEDLELAERWELEYSKPAPRARPERPAILQGPPLGCQEHPQGTLEECGPCGTAAERRRMFLARHKYEQQLELFVESQWEGVDRDVF